MVPPLRRPCHHLSIPLLALVPLFLALASAMDPSLQGEAEDGDEKLGDEAAATRSSPGLKLRGHSGPLIPRQLVLTSKKASIEELPVEVRRNIQNTLKLDPDLRVRWFNDAACLDYLKEHYGEKFSDMLKEEPHGSFRGDICRAAVLYREGGFYTDLDVQLQQPLTSLVDDKTTFMSCFTADGAILNALLASAPRNAVMARTLRELRKWYRGDVSHQAEESEGSTNEWMGPLTMLRALRAVTEQSCPGSSIEEKKVERPWTCGSQSFRFYEEQALECDEDVPTSDCPRSRATTEFSGARFGIYTPGPQQKLIGWPRFEACQDWGCQGGGWDDSPVSGTWTSTTKTEVGTEEEEVDLQHEM